MKYASLFSGIGGFDLGLQRTGMECVLQCDNDKSCLKLLSQKWPGVKRIEDVKKIKRISADLICGGFPCQDVSIAGRRKGLVGERSGLWYEFARIIKASHPQWVIVENVPGLLSSHGGRDFQTIIESLVEFGYGVVWRILDSRYFGVAQRRRRVFVVGSLGSGRSAEVLFESESVSGNIEKGREAGEVFAFSAGQGAKAGGIGYGKESPTLKGARSGTNQVPAIAFQQNTRDEVRLINGDGNIVGALSAQAGMKQQNYIANPIGAHHPRNDLDNETYVCGTLAASGAGIDRPGGQGNELDFCIPVGKPLSSKNQWIDYETETLLPVAFTASEQANSFAWKKPYYPTLDAQVPNDTSNIQKGVRTIGGVRRLTPTECERLQSFPDGWTEGFADSTRYRMLGNAVTVNVIEWIGERILEAMK